MLLAPALAISPIKTKREPLNENGERPRIRLRKFDRCFCMANDGQDLVARPRAICHQHVKFHQDQQILSNSRRTRPFKSTFLGPLQGGERRTVSGVALLGPSALAAPVPIPYLGVGHNF
jgi:hypothetical protein